VSQQFLDGAQIRTGIEQMSGKAMPQHMGVDLLYKAASFRCSQTRLPWDFSRDWG